MGIWTLSDYFLQAEVSLEDEPFQDGVLSQSSNKQSLRVSLAMLSNCESSWSILCEFKSYGSIHRNIESLNWFWVMFNHCDSFWVVIKSAR